MSQETFWILLSKKLSGEASEAEIKELESLILEHPEWQYAIQNLEDLWNHQPKKDNLQEEDAFMLHLNRMAELNIPFGDGQAEPRPARTSYIFRKWYWIAAAAFLLTSSLLFYFQQTRVTPTENFSSQDNEITTRRGSKSKVQLPDGTVVLLNAGSKLTYNKDFGKDLREVTLSGEGFFEVKKMEDKPFIIHTSSINIKVLGTVFNVRAYPEDKLTETSLIKGSIEVTMKNRPNDKIILSPSEKLVLENFTSIEKVITKEKNVVNIPEISPRLVMSVNKLNYNLSDSAVAETQWIDNKLVFRDESFEDLVKRMERWYDVDININDAALRQKRFSGIFEKESINEALEALKISVSFRYAHTGNKIIIHH